MAFANEVRLGSFAAGLDPIARGEGGRDAEESVYDVLLHRSITHRPGDIVAMLDADTSSAVVPEEGRGAGEDAASCDDMDVLDIEVEVEAPASSSSSSSSSATETTSVPKTLFGEVQRLHADGQLLVRWSDGCYSLVPPRSVVSLGFNDPTSGASQAVTGATASFGAAIGGASGGGMPNQRVIAIDVTHGGSADSTRQAVETAFRQAGAAITKEHSTTIMQSIAAMRQQGLAGTRQVGTVSAVQSIVLPASMPPSLPAHDSTSRVASAGPSTAVPSSTSTDSKQLATGMLAPTQ